MFSRITITFTSTKALQRQVGISNSPQATFSSWVPGARIPVYLPRPESSPRLSVAAELSRAESSRTLGQLRAPGVAPEATP